MTATPATPSVADAQHTELLLLSDGRVLVHNLTPTFAALLAGLNAQDERSGRTATRAEAFHALRPHSE